MYAKLTIFFLLSLPRIVFGDTESYDLSALIEDLLQIGNAFIFFLMAIAIAAFIYNVIKYFLVETDNVSQRENARNHALYGILAFLIIVIFWGLVEFLVNGLSLFQQTSPIPDYISPDQSG